ncbi:uncharacterized protein Tco025E_00952 [Trypanosoma conorhini]|uniref:SET domain-containing protein n=1 Tax=Trypanosoma conorhini TaxID=83891 RepID=A0A3S5IUM6_9TRYP|nr:uncharacterized protein Tco025E_00952 [Trypanosoma conorhini]RNF26796.1 hypothetical protein Tco025E_00952 [Trypanosoma conorhini]
MPRFCLRCTRRGPLCRLAADAAGAGAAAAVTSRRYRGSHEREDVDGTGTGNVAKGEAAEGPTQRLQAAAARAVRYPQVRVALRPSAVEEAEPGLEKAPQRQGTVAAEEDELQAFLREKRCEVEGAHLERNAAIPYPTHPDDVVPEFRRIKRHQAIVVVATDPDYPVFARQDQFVQLPPPESHPWVKNTPIGPFVVHGDGQLGVVGSGEVGFDDGHAAAALPRSFRGLQHRSVLQQRLPEKNGKVIQDAVVKNSFTLTGRGVFATRDIAAGETLMVVRDTASNLGVKGEVERLVEMCSEVLLTAYEGGPAELSYLHDWVFTGQPSSLLEFWPASATERVLERIGGVEVLHALELHNIHVARLAAIIDMNSFLVESSYAVRKGMAYFPEAGFLNHSCAPNATYDVLPEHTFRESEYYLDEVAAGAPPPVPQDAAIANRSHAADATMAGAADAATARELTTATAVQYLFCCRATANIPAGAEILISYVPPEWSFDNRQYVLHDRYRFWCKCSKCAPTLDATYARVPRFIVLMLFFSILLQLLVLHQRDVEQAAAREASATEESFALHGEEADDGEADGDGQAAGVRRRRQRPPRPRPRGLFELLEEDRLQDLYALDRGRIPAPLANDPWARPPR